MDSSPGGTSEQVEDSCPAKNSVTVTAVIRFTGRITPDHPFMGHLMNVVTEMNTAGSNHHERSCFNQVQNNRKMIVQNIPSRRSFCFLIAHCERFNYLNPAINRWWCKTPQERFWGSETSAELAKAEKSLRRPRGLVPQTRWNSIPDRGEKTMKQNQRCDRRH